MKKYLGLTLLASAISASAAALPMPPTVKPVELLDGKVSIVAVTPTLKVLPKDNFAPATLDRKYKKIYLAGAPGESEQIQLAIKPDKPLTNLTVHFEPLRGKNGSVAPANWSARRIHNVNVPNFGRWYGIMASQTGMIPDPVAAEAKMNFTSGEYGALLLNLNIPETLAAGNYSGILTLNADNFKQQIPVELQVWNFRFPEQNKLDTVACGANFEKNPGVMELMKGVVTHVKYGVEGGLKIKYDKASGKLTIDASKYLDKIAKYAKDYDVKFTLPPSLLGSGSRLWWYMRSDKKPGDPGFEKIHAQFLSQMREQAKARGLEHHLFYYVMDEFPTRNFPIFNKVAAQSRKVFPEMPVMALPGDPATDELLENTNIWCLPWHFFVTRHDHIPRWKKLQQEKGIKFWAYMNSLYHINATWNPKAMRFFPIALAGYGHSGALWWHIAHWGRDPKSNVWKEAVPMTRGPKSPDKLYGSGYLFYPPRTKDEGWSSSLRWENYVQGAEDYRLMMLLKERWEKSRKALNVNLEDFSGTAAVEMFWAMLGTSFRAQHYYADPLYISRFRQLLAHEISNHDLKPLALVDIQPTDARTLEAIHVRGITEKGCKFKVNGEDPGWTASDGSSFSTELLLKPGYNLITIRITGKDGKVKNIYREVFKK